MTVRAQQMLEHSNIKSFTVVTSNVTAGQAVKQSGADLSVVGIGAVTDFAIGIAIEDAVVGAMVRVALWGTGIAKVKVGTGGATRGNPAKYAANGLTNGTVGGATTAIFFCGQFLESGVAGDLVGLNLAAAGFSVGS